MFDIGEPNAPDNWRQARIDLADYAGQSNLRLRFDFATPGAITPDDSMPADVEGWGWSHRSRAENNRFEGFYIDDIIIGFAERGEMITGPTDQRSNSTSSKCRRTPFLVPPSSRW